jgi:hypothetical protein
VQSTLQNLKNLAVAHHHIRLTARRSESEVLVILSKRSLILFSSWEEFSSLNFSFPIFLRVVYDLLLAFDANSLPRTNERYYTFNEVVLEFLETL